MDVTAPGVGFTLDLPLAVFSVDAVKRAAYALMARYDVVIDVDGHVIRCLLSASRPDVDMSTAERDFRREVLDQDLRISVEGRTETYRDTILGLAFSRTGLQGG